MNLSAVIGINWVCRGLFSHVLCRRDMPFLEKLADIAVSGRHVADMSATFPAKRPSLGFFCFTANVLLLLIPEKQGYGGTKITIPVKNGRSERKIQESEEFQQEYATYLCRPKQLSVRINAAQENPI